MSHTLVMHLARVSQHGSEAEKRQVRSAVAEKVP